MAKCNLKLIVVATGMAAALAFSPTTHAQDNSGKPEPGDSKKSRARALSKISRRLTLWMSQTDDMLALFKLPSPGSGTVRLREFADSLGQGTQIYNRPNGSALITLLTLLESYDRQDSLVSGTIQSTPVSGWSAFYSGERCRELMGLLDDEFCSGDISFGYAPGSEGLQPDTARLKSHLFLLHRVFVDDSRLTWHVIPQH
jgi:hypothetical protein